MKLIMSFVFFLCNSLDATNSSRKCRFANDAGPRDDRQNAVMKCIPVNGTPHLGLFAAMKIGIGVEIRYDYGVKDLPWRRQVVVSLYRKSGNFYVDLFLRIWVKKLLINFYASNFCKLSMVLKIKITEDFPIRLFFK
jgi:hypothetical protein